MRVTVRYKTLIELGKVNLNDNSLDLPYHPLLLHPATKNRLNMVRFLVENRYTDVNKTKSRNYSQCTALMCAAYGVQIALREYLIDSGGDLNVIPKRLLSPF